MTDAEPTVATTENPSEDFAEKFDRSDVVDEPVAEKPKTKSKSTRAKKADADLDEHPDGIWSITAGGPTVDRTVTVHKPYTYRELAADIDWSGDWRELAALNKIRNGRYAIEPNTVINVPATRLPVRELSSNQIAKLAELQKAAKKKS